MTRNHVEAAVAPLKSEAVARAEQHARETIARVHSQLEAAGWNLDEVAPRGKSTMSRAAYQQANGRRALFQSIVKVEYVRTGLTHQTAMASKSEEQEARFVAEAKVDAAAQYDAFVAKLVAKVAASCGEVVHAELKGSHVWGYSVLTVKSVDGKVEHWKTQQILNVSALGKLFNQWPSRKVKSAA